MKDLSKVFIPITTLSISDIYYLQNIVGGEIISQENKIIKLEKEIDSPKRKQYIKAINKQIRHDSILREKLCQILDEFKKIRKNQHVN